MHILQIGCGALGTLVAEATLAAGHALTVVRQSDRPVPHGAQGLQLNVQSVAALAPLRDIPAEIVLVCLAPVAGQSYQQTYVDGLRNVMQQLNPQALKHVFFVSSTGVYGEQHGEWVDDDTPALPSEPSGQVLLAAERCLQTCACGYTALRVSGIYGPQRLYLLRLLQQPDRWPQGTHWTNRVHEQDVVATLMHLYSRVAHGLPLPTHLIVSDGAPAPQHTVLQWLAQQLHSPAPPTPAASPVSGKRIRNQRLQELGITLQYPDYQTGYQAILSGQARA